MLIFPPSGEADKPKLVSVRGREVQGIVSCRALLSGWILFLLVLVFSSGDARGNAVSLEEYRFSIREALSRIESGKGVLKPEEDAFLEERFPSSLDVKTRSGEAVKVDNASLLRLAKQSRENAQGRRDLITYLKALGRQISFVDQPLPLSEDRWEQSRALLDKVLAKSEFRAPAEPKEPPWRDFLMEVMRKVAQWMQRRSFGIPVYGKWTEIVLYGVILGGSLLLVLWLYRAFGHPGRGFRNRRTPSGSGRKAPTMKWRSLRDESRRKEGEGAYREAVRLFFISVLLQGDERGWWVYRREATNGQHLREVRGDSPRREALANMIRAYEKAWYGHEPPAKDTLLQCAAWLKRMETGR